MSFVDSIRNIHGAKHHSVGHAITGVFISRDKPPLVSRRRLINIPHLTGLRLDGNWNLRNELQRYDACTKRYVGVETPPLFLKTE
ncbi:hypothetical protein GCM10023156_17410 [Novipirellula rosea]|uniref:Uncharacterized protein n=1 Tax=Novipirellula rosea TaxID=1031540 RepID=A0ABP8MLI7_9BACT